MDQVAAYDEAVQWVPFVINYEALANPLVNSAMGQRIIHERKNNTNVLPAVTGSTSNNSALMVRSLTNGSAAAQLTLSPAMSLTPSAELAQKVTGTKTGSIPKKRLRINMDVSDEAEEENAEMVLSKEHNEEPPAKMNIISWNCRGLGGPLAVPNLKYLVRVYKPDVLFLCETLSNSNKTEEFRYVLGFDYCFTVNREGRGGGLVLFWNSSFNCTISSYSQNHIDVEVGDAVSGNWRLTCYYGFPGSGQRRTAWNFLRQLSHVSNLPWCIVGDFNDILSSNEKKGRNERASSLINGFRSSVLDSGLSDVHMEGYPFTWFKSLGTVRAVEERLDRALATENWHILFPNAIVENLPAPASDHYPILLVREPDSRLQRGQSRFKFENAWLVDPECSIFVKQQWSTYGSQGITQKLNCCAKDLSQWSKTHFHNIRREVDKCRKKLDRIRVHVDSYNINLFNALRKRKYLGLPSLIGRSKKATFNFIKDRVWKKINSWSSKCLSKAGREVLIKSVLQAIPNYFMSIFLLPSSLCDEIEKLMNSFWWGHSGTQNKGINWLSWDKLSMHKDDGGMGFKDLSAFNLAMIGKQSWRILTSPNILIAKLYKAKYFPNCNFLDSSLGHNPSFVWRSICNSKFLIRAGCRWRIGDGNNIPLWNENWLADALPLEPINHNNLMYSGFTVSDLMENDSKDWNVRRISSMFDQTSVARILATPLYPSVSDDRRLWRGESKGEYSVRSAYRICVHELLDTSHLRVNGSWNLVWNIEAPPKVKNLVWRVCRKCFPTRVRLRDKGVDCTQICALCVANNNDAPTIIFQILQQLSKDDSAVFACVLWSIWKQRNNQIWNNVIDAQHFVFSRAINMLQDWKAVRIVTSKPGPTVQDSAVRSWRRPTIGRVKCNIDASFPPSSDRVGIGICIRDEHGAFVLAKTEWFTPKCEVHIGEALGLLSALKWVHELQLGPVDFEFDSKRVVDSFHSSVKDYSEFGVIMDHCNLVFNNYYRNSSVEFVRRQANEVAHCLAKAATLSASFQILVHAPSCIEHILINEML
ncbi:unnamed protein product [Trifolium pratense]|uniref:Uncharacterized protein n=1 Tax=Trifolium pratense TaxID=57577 RepID=A0ACB0JTF6_TRIPR|nr:unnamed protein product [Trifolium pratense]